MKMSIRFHSVLPGLAATALVAFAALAPAPLSAAEYWLQAQETSKVIATATTPPASETVRVWTYASCSDSTFSTCAVTTPGPILRVASGEPLTIHLKNALVRGGTPITLSHVAAYGGAAVPTSIQIAGLPMPLFDGAQAAPVPIPAGSDGAGRIRSFTSEVPNGETHIYSWTAAQLRAGSFIYQSGTHPALQVQMGLYGAVVVESPAGSCTGPRCAYPAVGAYPGVGFDHEVVAVYSELDPLLHTQVANDTYGDATTAKTSTIIYEPQYFFVNGAVDGAAVPTALTSPLTSLDQRMVGAANDRILLRLLNAGLESHSPVLLGAAFTVVGEDGNPSQATMLGHSQYSTLLPAGKSLEAIWTAGASGVFPLIDHRRQTAHAAPAQLGTGGSVVAAASGALVKLEIGAAPPAGPPGAPLTASDTYATNPGVTLAVPSAGVLANDPCRLDATPCSNVTVAGSLPAHGTLTLNPDGSFTYVPALNYQGPDSFRYTVSNGSLSSLATLVTISVNTVNHPPVAVNDTFSIVGGGTNTVAAPGVLLNDTDADGGTLTAVLDIQPSNATITLNANGSFSVAPAGFTGTAVFTYHAVDSSGAASNAATVTVTVTNPQFQIANGGVTFNSATHRYSASGTTTLPRNRLLTFRLQQPGATTSQLVAAALVSSTGTWSFSLVINGVTALPGSTVQVTSLGNSPPFVPVVVPVIIQ
jgi:FtsP/CotA-like multicopper oxidase with cupredoxin domain